MASAIFSTSIMAFLKIHQRFEGHFLNELSFKNSQGLEHNSLLIQDCQNLAETNCMISVILWFHTFNLCSCINLVITRYELQSQYVKLTQLWFLTVNCVLNLIWQDYHKIIKNLFPLHICRPMIIQQRFNVLLQLQLYNIFTNILSIISESFH